MPASQVSDGPTGHPRSEAGDTGMKLNVSCVATWSLPRPVLGFAPFPGHSGRKLAFPQQSPESYRPPLGWWAGRAGGGREMRWFHPLGCHTELIPLEKRHFLAGPAHVHLKAGRTPCAMRACSLPKGVFCKMRVPGKATVAPLQSLARGPDSKARTVPSVSLTITASTEGRAWGRGGLKCLKWDPPGHEPLPCGK